MKTFADLRHSVDPRIESDLHWRYHFADGEIKALPSIGLGGMYLPIVNVDELRCGPIEVIASRPAWRPVADIDWRCCEAASRARRIDNALRECSALAREALWRAYGARVDLPLAQFGGASTSGTLVQPLLCNLVELAPEVRAMWARSGTPRTQREWLERIAAKASRNGQGDKVSLLLEAARGLLERSAREYGEARRRG